MNAEIIRDSWGKHQIKLRAMKWRDFIKLIEELDHLRYPG